MRTLIRFLLVRTLFKGTCFRLDGCTEESNGITFEKAKKVINWVITGKEEA